MSHNWILSDLNEVWCFLFFSSFFYCKTQTKHQNERIKQKKLCLFKSNDRQSQAMRLNKIRLNTSMTYTWMTDAAIVALNCVEVIVAKKKSVGIKILRYVPNYNIHNNTRAQPTVCFTPYTSGELPSLPSLLPTSKSAHDKQYIDNNNNKRRGKTHSQLGRQHHTFVRRHKHRRLRRSVQPKRRNRSTAHRI